MPRYVALLRGVNVGGKKLPMADLREAAGAIGARDVSTYIQSGNVILTRTGSAAAAARALERHLLEHCGCETTVLVRTPAQLDAVIAANPFHSPKKDTKHLYVSFLGASPPAPRANELSGRTSGADECRVVGDVVYVSCPGGYGETKLSNAFIERQLGVPATTRNWNTLCTLAELGRA